MKRNLVIFLALFAVWFVFSGYSESFFLVCGVVSCAISLHFARKMNAADNSLPLYIRPKSLLYFMWLTKEMLVSSAVVALKTWQTKPDIKPRLTWVPTVQENDVGRALYANSITLTPGTVCTFVDDDQMQIHTILEGGIEGLREGNMDRRVAEVAG